MSGAASAFTLSGPIDCVVGARPNFMTMAPILRALAAHLPPLPMLLVHTGQHYDAEMSDRLFADLGLPRPDVNLEVGSASHAVQTADVMRRFEPVIDEHRPSAVIVFGDVYSTLACTLVAVARARRWRASKPTCAAATAPCRKRSTVSCMAATASSPCIARRTSTSPDAAGTARRSGGGAAVLFLPLPPAGEGWGERAGDAPSPFERQIRRAP